MQPDRKPIMRRDTAMAIAMQDACVVHLRKGGTLPPCVANHIPSRARKTEPTWTVTRRSK